MKPYIVLQTEGKRDEIGSFRVLLFEDKTAAEVYCDQVNNNSKYFVHAEIVKEGEEVYLEREEGDCGYEYFYERV